MNKLKIILKRAGEISLKIIREIMAQAAREPKKAASAGIVLLIIIIAVVINNRDNGRSDGKIEPLHRVKSGPLTISVSESGRLNNKDEIILKNETDRSLKILSLIEEGTMVKKDDLILELESDDLETARDNNELSVKRIESDLTAAKERREVLKSLKQSNIDKEEVNLKFFKLDMERFTEGVHPKNLEKAEADITIAEANLERAEKDYVWSKKLQDKGFITLKELKADELTARQNSINLKIKKSDRDLLVKYTHPQEIETLEANIKQTEMALDRAQRTAKAELTGQMAELMNYEAQLKSARKELAKSEERLAACKILAPADGMVVYATSSGGRHSWEREPMEVGATVHPMHRLIRMPTSKDMLAIISVQEATKPKLYEGMAAVVTVDALPGQVFQGKLAKIGILPDSTQAWLNPDLKVYNCEIELELENDMMRPGMSCHVEIVIEEHKNAMFVPIQCVLQVDNKPTVFLKKRGGFEKRVIKTGMNNNIMIHVLSGLKNGDEVMLAPPLEAAAKNGRKSNEVSDQEKVQPQAGTPDKPRKNDAKDQKKAKAPAGKSGKPRKQDKE